MSESPATPPAAPPAAALPAPSPAPSSGAATTFGLPISGGDIGAACDRLASRPWLGLAIFLVIAFAAYAYAIPNEFVFDDNSTLRKNTFVRNPSHIVEMFDWSVSANARTYRPIRYISFMIDYAIGGDNPWIFHIFNSLYHGLTCFLVWRLLLRLAGDARAALAGALLFTLHPAHTECVAYISGRRDLLTTLFYVGAFLAFLRARDALGYAVDRAAGIAGAGGAPSAPSAGVAPEGTRSIRGMLGWGAASAALLLLALGSKEMAVTFPAVVILYLVVFDAKTLGPLLTPRVTVALVASIAVFSALAGNVIWRTISSHISGQTGPWGGTWSVHAMTAACLVANYVRLCVFPGTLLADYSTDAFPLARSLAEPRTIASIVTLLACAGIAIATIRRAPRVAFGLAWFFIALAPVSQIVPYHELGADHYIYLPSIGFCLIAGLGLVRLWERFGPEPAIGLLAVVLVALGVRTEVRIADWRDAVSVYRSTLMTAPRCARATLNLGSIIASAPRANEAERRANLRRALPFYSRAIEIDPDYIFARTSRARIYGLLGRKSEEVAENERALEIAKRTIRPPVPVETILQALERWQEAKEFLEKRVPAKGGRARDVLLLGRCLEKLGDDKKALAMYERASTATSASFVDQAVLGAARLAHKLGDKAKSQRYLKQLEQILGPKKFAELGSRGRGSTGSQAGSGPRPPAPVPTGAPAPTGAAAAGARERPPLAIDIGRGGPRTVSWSGLPSDGLADPDPDPLDADPQPRGP